MAGELPREEAGLVARAQRGDREAFAALVQRSRAGVIQVVYRLCGDPALAEDAAQVAFLRAWQHLPAYQPRASFRAWLYRIAVNAALDALRRERPAASLEDEETLTAPFEPVERRVEQHQRAELVRRAVLDLPPASRAALVLREYQGLSYAEIADALEIPIGTVMSRLSAARTRLEALLRPLLEEA